MEARKIREEKSIGKRVVFSFSVYSFSYPRFSTKYQKSMFEAERQQAEEECTVCKEDRDG